MSEEVTELTVSDHIERQEDSVFDQHIEKRPQTKKRLIMLYATCLLLIDEPVWRVPSHLRYYHKPKESGCRLTTELFGQPCKSEDQLEIIPRSGTQTAVDWFNDIWFLYNYLKSFRYSHLLEFEWLCISTHQLNDAVLKIIKISNSLTGWWSLHEFRHQQCIFTICCRRRRR